MLCKEFNTTKKNQSSANTSTNFDKKQTVAKATHGKAASFLKNYQVEYPTCGLNYWGAGSMDKDLMF